MASETVKGQVPSQKRIFVLLEEYRPGLCGVSDHTDVLIAHLTGFEFQIGSLAQAKAALKSASPPHCLLVQFTVFAFSPNGLFFNLLSVCKEASKAGIALVTFCHEAPLGLLPIRRSLVLAPIQRWLFNSLRTASDLVVANQLRALNGLACDKALYSPTFSNAGEIEPCLPPDQREPSVVLFGIAHKRRESAKRILAMGGVAKLFGPQALLIEIGGGGQSVPAGTPGWHYSGLCSAQQVSDYLAKTRFGIFNCPPNEISKSGVYAACCAHGAIPVNANPLAWADSAQEVPTAQADQGNLLPAALPLNRCPALPHVQAQVFGMVRQWFQKYRISQTVSSIEGRLNQLLKA